VVHLIRNSLEYVGWKDRKAVAAELKTIYRAETAEAALGRASGAGSVGKSRRKVANERVVQGKT